MIMVILIYALGRAYDSKAHFNLSRDEIVCRKTSKNNLETNLLVSVTITI